MRDVLGDCLQARLALMVLRAADERRLLVVKAAIGWRGHGVLLLLGASAAATETMKFALDVLGTQVRGLDA